LFSLERPLFLLYQLPREAMKKVVIFLILAGFVSACSQYTCPTYSKKEVPAKKATEKRI